MIKQKNVINKRQDLIDTALRLFYLNGINSVGINEVIKASGVAKKTLYHHFKSKDELILATLEARDTIWLTWFESKLATTAQPQEAIRAIFHALTEWFNDRVTELTPFRGCFFINTAAEFDDEESPIALYCKLHKQKVRNLIVKYMGETESDVIDLICFLKEGAITTAHISKDKYAAEKCLLLVNSMTSIK